MQSLIKEFKEFALRGNVVDMAVGFIIGGAFSKVVSSLVADILMPPLGKVIGGVNFGNLRLSLGQTLEQVQKDGQTVTVVKEAFLNYGAFLQHTFDFLILAIALFTVVKLMNEARAAMEGPIEAAPVPPPEDILLLREIRDALQK